MKASVIVLSWNGVDYLESCLNAVLSQDYADFEVIVVDNGSTDGSADLVAERFPQVQLIRNERNLGFARGNNIGLRAATGDVLVLLNQDTVVHDGWLAALVAALKDPTVGIAGCKLLYPDGTLQHAGGEIAGPRCYSTHYGAHTADTGAFEQVCDVDFVTGAALALTRTTLKMVGELDEGFAPAYYEDVDWCYRCRAAGLRVSYVSQAVAMHYESASAPRSAYRSQYAFHHGRLRFLFKHSPLADLLNVFWPAELAWLSELGRPQELMAARAVYLELFLCLSDILRLRSDIAPEAVAQLVALLLSLRQASGEIEVPVAGPFLDRVTAELPEVESSTQEVTEPEGVDTPVSVEDVLEPSVQVAPPVHFVDRQQKLTALSEMWQLKEQPFTSNIPILGSAIAAFRAKFNEISTRWYVQPLIQQQNRFNVAVLEMLHCAHRRCESQLLTSAARQADTMRDAAGNIRELTLLAEHLAELEHELATLAQRLDTQSDE